MQAPSLASPVFIACAFRDRAALEDALRALLAAGIPAGDIGIGARERAGAAAEIATMFGVRADVDPADPLAGAAGLASDEVAKDSINRGGVVGGLVGVLTGAAIGFFPNVHLVPVAPQWRLLSDALLCFLIGALAGATVGGAFAPQRSTHAAFRIVDEIEHGGFAVVVSVDDTMANNARDILTSHGGLHVLRVPSDE